MRGLRNAIAIILGIGAVLVACAPVQFSTIKDPAAQAVSCSSTGRTCVTTPTVTHVSESFAAPSSSADVLFVVDNSASMSPIHHQIATRFANFIAALGALDYRIALTTTDVYKTAGNLLSFQTGGPVLTRSSTSDPQTVFGNLIQRPETIACEQYLNTHDCHQSNACSDYANYCPSEDTRGIYAATLAVQRADASFMRASVPLSIVIVSNADERAAGGRVSGTYPMQSVDYPSSLTNLFASRFGSTKSLTVHSIVIPTGDSGCLAAQRTSDLIFGWTGDQYVNLSNATGGRVGSVCEGDYASQLGAIGGTIANSPSYHDLSCAPVAGTFQITLSPADATANPTVSGSRVQFAHALPPSTTVTLTYDCAN